MSENKTGPVTKTVALGLKDSVQIDESQLLSLINKILHHPYGEICKHAVCADILDLLEKNGSTLNAELVKAVVFAEDEKAIAILDSLPKLEPKQTLSVK